MYFPNLTCLGVEASRASHHQPNHALRKNVYIIIRTNMHEQSVPRGTLYVQTRRGREGGRVGARLLLVNRRLRTLLQRLPIPDHAFAVKARQLEILGKFERVGRTSVLA